jgi:hypothetical protein
MATPNRFAWPLPVVAVVLASAAAAGTPDPSTLRDQLEEQVLEGDADAEDVAVFHLPARSIAAPRVGASYVALAAFAGSAGVRRQWGGFLVVQFPFERVAKVRPLPRPADGVDPPWSASSETDAAPLRLLPAGIFDGPRSADKIETGPVVVTPEVARSCVRAAWRVLGIADDASLDSMSSRARTSAVLPELRLRAMRTMDASGRVTSSDADPYRYTEAGGATNWLEARLTFRLDRLIFADEEISLERVRLDRSEVRARTAAKVLQALFEWQRAYALVQEPAASSAEHFAAVLRELEASAILDVMTDGWFGRFRGSLK